MIEVEALESIIEHKEILNHTQKDEREKRKVIGNHLITLNKQVTDYCNPILDYDTLIPMPTTPELKSALYGLYDSKEKLIADMKEEIKTKYKYNPFSNNSERCPYCGILRQKPSVLDHFIPRGVFPEYSILSKNLVYICERCNNTSHKGQLINDKTTGRRLFLHPYTDDLGSYTFIKCHLYIEDLIVTPIFTINKDILKVDPNLYYIACTHMKILKLNDYYADLVQNDLLDKFRMKFTSLNKEKRIRQYKEGITLDEILLFIKGKIDECDESYLNNWEIAFWKEFILEENWFNSLAGKELETESLEKLYNKT